MAVRSGAPSRSPNSRNARRRTYRKQHQAVVPRLQASSRATEFLPGDEQVVFSIWGRGTSLRRSCQTDRALVQKLSAQKEVPSRL